MKTNHVLLLAVCFLIPACDRRSAAVPKPNQRSQQQMDDYERGIKRADDNLAQVERQTKHAEEQMARYDKILDKWEEQQKRLDALLERFEKEASVGEMTTVTSPNQPVERISAGGHSLHGRALGSAATAHLLRSAARRIIYNQITLWNILEGFYLSRMPSFVLASPFISSRSPADL